MPQVFISHVTDDDDIVTNIHNRLQAAGIDAWVDHINGIRFGDRWPLQIQEAVNNCDCGLFVLSPRSATSAYCEAEWYRVLELEKRLYIALIEAVPIRDFPLRLGTTQYADLTREFDAGLDELIRAIQCARNLNPAAPTIATVRHITGHFPHWMLDIPLIGRDTELAEVRGALAGGARVTAILGMGGIGKTRLAVEVINTAGFRDGALWHLLTTTGTVDHLTQAIREHLHLDPALDMDAVWAELGRRQLLITLDNAEDCTAPSTYAERLNALDLSGGTRILMTSRQRWPDLRGLRPVTLRVPDLDAAAGIAHGMAVYEPPDYSIDGYERSLGGAARQHPKLIWYAVHWANDRPPQEVITMLRELRGRDEEEALEDLVGKTVARMTAQEGGDEALHALRRLAVCRGGFTLETAAALLRGDTSVLRPLKQWGLISLEGGRHDVDPLVIAHVGEDTDAYSSHYNYFLALAQDHDARQNYTELDAESTNLDVAFERALAGDNAEAAFRLAIACSNFFVNRVRFEQHMDWLTRVAAPLEDHSSERLKAAVQNSLGNAYAQHPTSDRRANLQRAIAYYQAALEYYMPQTAPHNYTETKNNLGNVYCALSNIEDRAVNLGQGITCFKEALIHCDPLTAPHDYANTQNNLGNAYRMLSSIEDHATNLRHAVECYKIALKYYIKRLKPLNYAMAQNNLGNAYSALSEIEDPETNLRRAIVRYKIALKSYTQRTAPLDYAMTQNNLGETYRHLFEIEGQAAHLGSAIACYEAALVYRTPETVPLDYATTQNNLGLAHNTLAQIENPVENLRQAVECYRAALEYFTPQTAPLRYAGVLGNLGFVHSALAQIENPVENLRQAVECYRAALEYFTPQTAPLEYAKTQANLGQVHKNMGEIDTAVACWREAERYFQQMGHAEDADKVRRWIGEAEGRT